MKHDVLKHSDFFQHMEDFGYFRDLEEILPENFTAVFEIARVMEDPYSPLFQSIAPVMTVSSMPQEKKAPTREWKPNRNVSHGEEYEAALMTSISDIKRIFPHQYLLPDEIFLHRLARRSLWINVPKTPITLPYKTSASDFAPNNFKQKVYVLLDTSTSMTSHHRFQVAKAVVYVFLKRNLKELGHVYFRTFDTDLGPLQIATDFKSLRELIQYAMRLHRLGNGTVMERAILQAIDDIKAQASLSGAEILMVTDGACHLDLHRIRTALGDSIRINTVKIGNAEIYADDRQLRDIITKGESPQQRELLKLEEELRRASYDLQTAITDADRTRFSADVNSLRSRIQQLRERLTTQLREHFGKEIVQLSSVYVNIDDVSSDQIFTLRQSEIDEIRQLVEEVEMDFEEGIDADSLREAALLYEHVQMLSHEEASPEQQGQLAEIASRLQELLKDVLHEGAQDSEALSTITRSDLHDLHMMLNMSSQRGDSILKLLLVFIRKVRSLLSMRKR